MGAAASAETQLSDSVRQITIQLTSCYVVAFADSAGGRAYGAKGGRKASQRSRSAIVVCAQDELEHIFCLKAWAEHCTTDELIEEIFSTQQQWKPAVFGIDATGTQNLFADALLREAREKGKRLPLVKWTFDGGDGAKDTRIETTIQPLQAAGKLFTVRGVDKLQREYEGFPGAVFKDILDAWAGCIKLLPSRPKAEEARDESLQYREYLRSQRVPEDEIQRRVAREIGIR